MTDREKIKKVFRMLRKEGFPALFRATNVDVEENYISLNGELKFSFHNDGSLVNGVAYYSWNSETKEGVKCAQLFITGLLEEGFEVTNQELAPTKAIGVKSKGYE